MSNVHEWDTTAANNNSAPPDGAPEGWLPSKVNDVVREMMAALAKWYQDNRAGSLVSASAVANAYTLTTNSSYAALSDIAIISFRVNAANTGAVTLNVDGLGAKSWKKKKGVAYASGDLVADQLVQIAYNATDDVFETVGGSVGEFDSATAIAAFKQTAAPTGWTKDTTANLNDCALRLVTGTVSSRTANSAFSTVFGLTSTDGFTLTNTYLPAHDHGSGTYSAASHDHSYTRYSTLPNNVSTTGGGVDYWKGTTSSDVSNSGALNVSGTSGSTGSGTAHAHDIDLQTNYHDVILAAKD